MNYDDDKWHPGGHGGPGWEKLYPAKRKEPDKMSQVTNHPTKESALTVVDALNYVRESKPTHSWSEWTYSVVQNAGGHWVVQIHDENDEFVGTL